MSETTTVLKGIQRLEDIGKKGKLSKIIKLSIDHFEHLKNSLNDFSLKILAYIIKGFFLTIKKSYENFNKDLENFIEVNIKGNDKIVIKKKEKIPIAAEKVEECFSLQNINLFSENTQFEQFLNDTNMTQRIQKTLKNISKLLFLF